MTVAGKNTVTLHNVLVGEVWLCSGQSNMEFALEGRPGVLGGACLSGCFSKPQLVVYRHAPRPAYPKPLRESPITACAAISSSLILMNSSFAIIGASNL